MSGSPRAEETRERGALPHGSGPSRVAGQILISGRTDADTPLGESRWPLPSNPHVLGGETSRGSARDAVEVQPCVVASLEECKVARFELADYPYNGEFGEMQEAPSMRLGVGDKIRVTFFETQTGERVVLALRLPA